MMQNPIVLFRYRPISLTSSYMERLLTKRLPWYLEKKLFNKSVSEWF